MILTRYKRFELITIDLLKLIHSIDIKRDETALNDIEKMRFQVYQMDKLINRSSLKRIFRSKKLENDIDRELSFRKHKHEIFHLETIDSYIRFISKLLEEYSFDIQIRSLLINEESFTVHIEILRTVIDLIEYKIKQSISLPTIQEHEEVLTNENTIIIGKAGSGKTVFLHRQISNSLEVGKKGMLIIDDEKSYIDLFKKSHVIEEIKIKSLPCELLECEGNYILIPSRGFHRASFEDSEFFSDIKKLILEKYSISSIIVDSDMYSSNILYHVAVLKLMNISFNLSFQCFFEFEQEQMYHELFTFNRGFILSDFGPRYSNEILTTHSKELVNRRFHNDSLRFYYMNMSEIRFNVHKCEELAIHNMNYKINKEIVSLLSDKKWFHYTDKSNGFVRPLLPGEENIDYCSYCGKKLGR